MSISQCVLGKSASGVPHVDGLGVVEATLVLDVDVSMSEGMLVRSKNQTLIPAVRHSIA